MIRSLYSGISGLKNHQIRMDSVGNNIANVNTVGYKSSRTNFMDAISQTIRSGGGGVNPAQLGTGINVGSVANIFTQGSLQGTGRNLDVSIQGRGFFVASDGANQYFTREGVFFLDSNDNLVNSNGYIMQGYATTTAGPDYDTSATGPFTGATTDINLPSADLDLSTLSIDKEGWITAIAKGGVNAGSRVFVAQVALATFPNQEGLMKSGQNLYTTSGASGAANIASTNHAANGAKSDILSGYVEMSNVDLSEEFVNLITTQRGYQANSRVITVSDTLLEELIQLKR